MDLLTPIFATRLPYHLPRFNAAKAPERFGLFVLIAQGESVAGVVRGLASSSGLTLKTSLIGVAGMAVAFAGWWIYFDFIARRPPRVTLFWTLSWMYLHMLLIMSFVATGAAIARLVSAASTSEVPGGVSLLIGASVGAFLILTAAIEVTLHRHESEPTHARLSPLIKLVTGAIAVGVGVLFRSIMPLSLLVVMFVLLSVSMVYGAWVWYSCNRDEIDFLPGGDIERPLE